MSRFGHGSVAAIVLMLSISTASIAESDSALEPIRGYTALQRTKDKKKIFGTTLSGKVEQILPGWTPEGQLEGTNLDKFTPATRKAFLEYADEINTLPFTKPNGFRCFGLFNGKGVLQPSAPGETKGGAKVALPSKVEPATAPAPAPAPGEEALPDTTANGFPVLRLYDPSGKRSVAKPSELSSHR